MNKLQDLKRKAQAEAERTGNAMAILNLNRFSPLYVIREWNPSMILNKDVLWTTLGDVA